MLKRRISPRGIVHYTVLTREEDFVDEALGFKVSLKIETTAQIAQMVVEDISKHGSIMLTAETPSGKKWQKEVFACYYNPSKTGEATLTFNLRKNDGKNSNATHSLITQMAKPTDYYKLRDIGESDVLLDIKVNGFHVMIIHRAISPCAYVKISDHPDFQEFTSELGFTAADFSPIKVHGGISYVENLNPKTRKRDRLWIGWDYGHDGDYLTFGHDHVHGKQYSLHEIARDILAVIIQITSVHHISELWGCAHA